MAESVEKVIPDPVLKLARDFGLEDADWYVGSAESGRGTGALAALRQRAREQQPNGQPSLDEKTDASAE